MMVPSEPQRLPSRLAPLGEALSRIDALARPVASREVELSAAAGRVLAAAVLVEAPLPPTAITPRDGWAVRADQVADAGPYAPVSPAPMLVTRDRTSAIKDHSTRLLTNRAARSPLGLLCTRAGKRPSKTTRTTPAWRTEPPTAMRTRKI
jgi:hypothetical protein